MPIPLPDSPHGPNPWQSLQVVTIANNRLTGTLPDYAYGSAPMLSIISVANNNLTGTIPLSFTMLSWLSILDLSYNQLSGPIPHMLPFQSLLTSLRLHDNERIDGTISPWFR